MAMSIGSVLRFVVVVLAVWLPVAPVQAGGWLGVTIEPPQGVQVAEIIKGSPADRAGLERGDIIRSLDGVEITGMGQFIQLVTGKPAGGEVMLQVIRRGEEREVRATLEESEEHRSVSQGHVPGWRLQYPPVMPERDPRQPPAFSYPERMEMGGPGSIPPGTAWPRDSMPMPPQSGFEPPPKAWLGVALEMAPGGVAVIGVAPDGPGMRAGLREGDVIVAINGQAVATPRALVRLINQQGPGDLVELAITRAGQARMLQAQLQAPPSGP